MATPKKNASDELSKRLAAGVAAALEAENDKTNKKIVEVREEVAGVARDVSGLRKEVDDRFAGFPQVNPEVFQQELLRLTSKKK